MRVLLVGTSYSAVPIAMGIKALGYELSVVGANAYEPCHFIADRSFFIDYSDREALLALCQENSFDYIVPSCNDYGYISASYVANDLNLPGFDKPRETQILHNKEKFREYCNKIGLPVPRVICSINSDNVGSLNEINHFPALIKPSDSFSGKGISKVFTNAELEPAIKAALQHSRNKEIVIEEFVTGSLHSISVFIEDQKIIWVDFVDEFCLILPYQVSNSSYPSSLSTGIQNSVIDSIQTLVKDLSLADGLLHTQFIVDKDKFWLIETMRRCPGDLFGEHFKFASGFDYTKAYFSAFLGIKTDFKIQEQESSLVQRSVLSSEGTILFQGIQSISGNSISYIFPLLNSGEKLEPAPNDKAAIVFNVFNDLDDQELDFDSKIMRY